MSITLVNYLTEFNDESGKALTYKSSIDYAKTQTQTVIPRTITHFRIDFDNYIRSDIWSLNFSNYIRIRDSNGDDLYTIDVENGNLKDSNGTILTNTSKYFEISNISEPITIEWNRPTIDNIDKNPNRPIQQNDYTKVDLYGLDPYIALFTNYTDQNYARISLTAQDSLPYSDLMMYITDLQYFEFDIYNISSLASVEFVDGNNSFTIDHENVEGIRYKVTLDTNNINNIKAGRYTIKITCNDVLLNNETVITKVREDNDIEIFIPYVFMRNDINSITPNIDELENVIDLTNFINDSSVFDGSTFVPYNTQYNRDWDSFEIKFTYDGNEQSFDINTNAKTFILDMLLKQFEGNVTCKFEIFLKNNPIGINQPILIYTSVNFILEKQTLNTSNFKLSLHASGNTILFQNDLDSQWIYMYESASLSNTNNIVYTEYIDKSNVSYNVYFIHGDNYSNESQSLNNSSTQKIKLKLTLTISGDTISLIDTTEFLIHKVDFGAFHTINPISNINYFKEKTFRFTVSDNKYSFEFDGNTYEKTFEDGIYSISSANKDGIIVTNPLSTEMSFSILPYNFINGQNTLTFKIVNTIEGVQTIYPGASTVVTQLITSIPINLNVESDAIISCIPS